MPSLVRLLAFAVLCASTLAFAQERREVGALVLDGIPEIPGAIAERMNQYQNVRAAYFSDWAPGGSGMLVSTRFGETQQLHLVQGPGAARQQLTFFDEPVRGALFDPKGRGESVLLARDAGGGEFYQLYWLDRLTGKTSLMTDGKSRNEGARFARAGGRFAYLSNRRNGVDFDLYLQASADPTSARLVKELPGQWAILDWSADDAKLLLRRYVSINESYLHLLDLASGALLEVNPRPGVRIAYGAAQFDGNGAVVATCDQDSEFLRLTRFDLKTGKSELLAPTLSWDVSHLVLSRDGKWLSYAVNEGGSSALYLGLTAQPQKATRVAMPRGVISSLGFDKERPRLGLSFSGADASEDTYSLDLKSRKLTRWTFSEVGGLNPSLFVTPERVEFPSFDGLKVPAWYFRPAPRHPGKRPVIISIHGGPESQSMASFNASAQYWVNELGAAVLLPNVRGSAGYGKSYLQLDNAEKREDSVKDLGALLDWVATRPELDASRVAVIGGSYGGFMVLAAMTRFADRLKCGVDVVGISHFVTFLEKTESYRRDLRRAEYGDERDPRMRAFLERISPLTSAKQITRPLFVVQGLNDPRVPVGEAEQIVKTVRQNGGTAWYLLAKDEGHGFQKKKNRDLYLNATSLFFERFLLQ